MFDERNQDPEQAFALEVETLIGEQDGAALVDALRRKDKKKVDEIIDSLDSEEEAEKRIMNVIRLSREQRVRENPELSSLDIEAPPTLGELMKFGDLDQEIEDLYHDFVAIKNFEGEYSLSAIIKTIPWIRFSNEKAVVDRLMPPLMDEYNKQQERIYRGLEKPKQKLSW